MATLFDPWFGSEFICTWKGQGVGAGEKLMARIVHVQRCQIFVPVAGHLAVLFTERKVGRLRQGFPSSGPSGGSRQWGARRGMSESF